MKIKFSTLWAVSFLVIPLLSFGRPMSARELMGATLSADGKTAYGLTQTHSTKISSPVVYLEVVDVQTGEKTASHKIPADFFQRAYLFNQGLDTFVLVPQKPGANQKSKPHVYVCKPNERPQLISGDDFFLSSQLDEPHIFHNQGVLIGEDLGGTQALLFIQEGKTTVFPLPEQEALAAGIQYIRYDTRHTSNLPMAFIEVGLHNTQRLYLSPFLTSAGVPLMERVSIMETGGQENALLRFAKAYYGDNKILVADDQRDASSKLLAVPLEQIRSGRRETPLVTETLYHAKVVSHGPQTQWVLGYVGANRKQASVTGYKYDIQQESLTKLPTFDNMALDEVRSVLAFSDRHLILGMAGNQQTDALLVHLDTGKLLYASAFEFSDKSVQRFFSRLDTFEGRLLSGILLFFVVLGALLFLVVRLLRRKLGMQGNKRAQKKSWKGWLVVLGFFLAFSPIVVSVLFESPPTFLLVGLPLLGTALIIGGSFLGILGTRVKNGILVIGKISSAQQTGLRVNHQPQLEITVQFSTANGQELSASFKQIVSLQHLTQFQPGALIPIQYDPLNPQRIMLDKNVDQATLQEALNRYRVASGEVSQEAVDIAQNGVRAQGVILSAQPTGKIVNGRGEMALHLKVTRPDGTTFETTVKKAVPQEALSLILPGSVSEVRYLPRDEKNVVIVWRLS